MAKKQTLYMHQPTGNIMYATKSQAKKLNDEWSPVNFVKNDNGESVMRFTFNSMDGTVATVDVQANEVVGNGNRNAS